MDIKQITYFVQIVKSGSFTRAAEELALSQPALSKQIQLLERELKTELLDRSGKTINLTPSGELFHARAIRLYDEYRNLINTDYASGQIQGKYVISAGSTVAAWVLPEILLQIRKRFKNISFRVIEGDAVQTKQSLLKGEADIGILTSDFNEADLDRKQFFTDNILPVIHKNHPLLKQKKICLQDLNEIPFVMFHPASSIRQSLEKKLIENDLDFHPEIVMELRSVESVLQSVAAGLGAGFLSELSIASPLVPIRFPKLETKRNFYFYFRKSRQEGIQWLIKEMQTLYLSGQTQGQIR